MHNKVSFNTCILALAVVRVQVMQAAPPWEAT